MSNDETPETRMPFYDGDRGWIAPEYKAPTPRFPGKHNLEGGWIFGGGNKKSYYDGNSGWVSEQPNEFPTESSGMSREEILTNKHKPGRRGWVASNWEKVYDKNDPYDTNPNLPVPSQPKPFVQSFQPPYSISNGEKTVVIEIELPGVSPENVSLEIVNQVSQQVPFTSASSEQALVCHRSPTASPASSTNCFLRVMGFKHSKWDKHKVFDEREYGFFERSVFLGNQVNKKSPMMAKLENGILTVCVAKPQQIKDSAAKKAK